MPENVFKIFKFTCGRREELEWHNQRKKWDFFDYTLLQRFNFEDTLYNYKMNLIYWNTNFKN